MYSFHLRIDDILDILGMLHAIRDLVQPEEYIDHEFVFHTQRNSKSFVFLKK
jgi:hypothetical protein